MFIDKKILGIVGLMVLAGALCWLDFVGVKPAKADVVLANAGYQLITAASSNGGDNLYIFDNTSGIMAVFVYDPSTRAMRPRGFLPVSRLFGR
jgi:hypothetical protein